MKNFVICTRNIKGGQFGDEPGPTTFLEIPDGVLDISPQYKISQKEFMEHMTKNQDIHNFLFFVHGYNNSKQDVMTRHFNLKEGLTKAGYAGEIVSFDWPSSNKAMMYLEDRHDAKVTAMELVRSGIALLAKQQNRDCKMKVHLLAHSTGAYIVNEAFDDSETTANTAEVNWTVSQLMFIAGDVSSDSMHNDRAGSVYRHCIRFTNYFNPHDSVLALSNAKRIGFKNRAGRVGLPMEVPSKAVDVNCGNFYEKNKDAIKVVNGAHSHSWYFYSEQWMKDAVLTMNGELDRNVFPTRTADNAGELFLK